MSARAIPCLSRRRRVGDRGVLEVLVNEGDGHAALAHGRGDAFDRTEPDVAAGENARDAGLEEVGVAVEVPPARRSHLRPGEDVAVVVERDLGRQPVGLRIGADEDVEPAGAQSFGFAADAIVDVDRLERNVAGRGGHLGVDERADVGARVELVDQVPGHALFQRCAAAEDGDGPGVGREEECGLAGGVARADDVHVLAVRVSRLAASRAVRDPLPCEAFKALHVELPPGDAAGEDDRARSDDVAAVEVDLSPRGVDAVNRAGDEDLGAETAGLLQRATGELVAGHAGREAEVILDPRGGTGLTAGSLTFHDDGAQPLGRPVDRRGQPAGPAPTTTVSYSAKSGSVPSPRSSATRRRCGRMTVLPPMTRIVGRSAACGGGPSQISPAFGSSGVIQRNVTWLRSRKSLRSVQLASHRWPKTIARGGGGSAARP